MNRTTYTKQDFQLILARDWSMPDTESMMYGPLNFEHNSLAHAYRALLHEFCEMTTTPLHDSDCAIFNEPAMPFGPCDCSISTENLAKDLLENARQLEAGDYNPIYCAQAMRKAAAALQPTPPAEVTE